MQTLPPKDSANDQEVRTMKRLRNDMDPKWTDSCLLKTSFSRRRSPSGKSLHTATIPFSSMSWFNLDFRESKPKFLSPNYFSTMAEITPHHYESLLVVFTMRESENPTQSLRFIISENIPVRSAAAQWMNKGHKHVGRKHLFWQMCLKLLLYNLVDDQNLEKYLYIYLYIYF